MIYKSPKCNWIFCKSAFYIPEEHTRVRWNNVLMYVTYGSKSKFFIFFKFIIIIIFFYVEGSRERVCTFASGGAVGHSNIAAPNPLRASSKNCWTLLLLLVQCDKDVLFSFSNNNNLYHGNGSANRKLNVQNNGNNRVWPLIFTLNNRGGEDWGIKKQNWTSQQQNFSKAVSELENT